MNSKSEGIGVNIGELTAPVVRLLYDYLLAADHVIARERFDNLLEPGSQSVAEMTAGEESNIEVRLALDTSEFVGKFEFKAFVHFLSHLLTTLTKVQEQGDGIPMREERRGQRYVVTVPAALEFEGQLNVMMLGFDLRAPRELVVELLFFEPGQFREVSRIT